LNVKEPSRGLNTEEPRMSAGRRSGVNCTRRKLPAKQRASAFARVVLPTPGTSSISRWWPASRATSTWSRASGLPRITRPSCSFTARSFSRVALLVPVAVLIGSSTAAGEIGEALRSSAL
jgi:hypothetical protein